MGTLRKNTVWIVILCFLGFACKNPNTGNSPVEILDEHAIERAVKDNTPNNAVNEVYVPIYSDIYNQTRDSRTLLTATLSIRNTSSKDSLFINKIDYFNTQGDLVRSYLNNSIYLKPLETIDYVIEEQDKEGGSGANFIIHWYGKSSLNPLFQAVMVGGLGSQAFSFTTEGIPVSK
ncbi:DUF3124 domain-containing protein [Euzebyella saccharophila]|uniref:DUF3124 domain-containing protein n=1 Tax=Euzebyella saccharophila TaxID=679664 RepID=A0ABV8JR72_9FLAO|nr:DUF3124 domain-containing protein [Euzebyella saccharophila]